MKDHIQALEDFTKELGIDLSKWILTGDFIDDTRSLDNEIRIIEYENIDNGEYTIYVIMEHFKSEEWMVVEFGLTGD